MIDSPLTDRRMPHDIFISYTQPDRETAFKAHDMFQANGLASWIAVSPTNGIPAGANFEGEIVRAIKASRAFVLIYSNYCNRSDNILRELRQRTKDQAIILFRLDDAPFADDISWYLKDSQHIDARYHLTEALRRLLTAVRESAAVPGSANSASTDQLLLNAGLRLLRQNNYALAAGRFQQYFDIAPDEPDAGFYLALALIAGRPTRKLDGMLVRRLESILAPANGAAHVLLAILKEGYYAGNGFRVPPPSPADLLENVTIAPGEADALLLHLDEPRDNLVWNYIRKQLSEQQ